MLLQLTIDDTSPTVSFSPFRDTLSTPNLSAGWNPYYATSGFASAPGQTGSGSSYHITSKNGAFLSLTWHGAVPFAPTGRSWLISHYIYLGTGIQLLGNATLSSYSVKLDGSDLPPNGTTPVSPSKPDGILADIDGLKDDKHTITLTVQIPQTQTPHNSSMLVFEKAVIKTGNAANKWGIFLFQSNKISLYPSIRRSSEILKPLYIDNSAIAFVGRWSFESASQGMSFHISDTAGDSVTTSFNGLVSKLFIYPNVDRSFKI